MSLYCYSARREEEMEYIEKPSTIRFDRNTEEIRESLSKLKTGDTVAIFYFYNNWQPELAKVYCISKGKIYTDNLGMYTSWNKDYGDSGNYAGVISAFKEDIDNV